MGILFLESRVCITLLAFVWCWIMFLSDRRNGLVSAVTENALIVIFLLGIDKTSEV